MDIDPADIIAMREQGDLKAYLLSLGGLAPKQPVKAESREPAYHIPRKGAWPCGTAPSGPTPPPCGNCPPGSSHPDHPTHHGTE